MMSDLASVPPSLFLLSFRKHDDLGAIAADAGWRVTATAHNEGAAAGFTESSAQLAVVDLRGAIEEGVAAVAAVAALSGVARGGLLVLVSREDVAALPALLAAGATHFLVDPQSGAEVRAAFEYAARAVRLPERRGETAPLLGWWITQQLAVGRPVDIAMIALTRFDIVNATYGRATGDALLQAAQQRIEAVARAVFGTGAAVARAQGSAFLLAAQGSDSAIEAAAGQIAEALARPFMVADGEAVLGCRIGIAIGGAGDDVEQLAQRARAALAVARASDSLTIYVARDPGGAGSTDALAIDLRGAIERGEIEVLFQPQVSVASGAIEGVEALARWEHPQLGPLGAEALFAAAGRADLGIGLSDHIQRSTLAQAAAWPAALAGLRLAINLTAADIARPGFADIFLDRVDESGFPRTRLTVEITEGGLIEDLGAAAALLAELRGAGVRVAIDDFGTGYSSLAYLKALPLDYLKIDKHLAQDIGGSTRDRIVVRGVIDMARSLGLAVIAEGVETPEQLDLLAREGCQYYQGFLYAPPLGGEALARLIIGLVKPPSTPR